MNWSLIWQFASVVVTAVVALGGFVWWVISTQTRAQTKDFQATIGVMRVSGTDFSHGLELRVRANEADVGQFKERFATMEARIGQVVSMRLDLDRFGQKLDTVATKLEVVADRIERATNSK